MTVGRSWGQRMTLILKTWKCFTPRISGKPCVQVTANYSMPLEPTCQH